MDKNTRQDLRRILKLYSEHRARELALDRSTVWVPTPLPILLGEIELIDSWYSKEGKRHEGEVLVPGAGDGARGVSLSILGYNVLCIEKILEVCDSGGTLVEKLAREGIIDRAQIRLIHGNYLDDGVYQSIGHRFEDYTKLFVRMSRENLNSLLLKVTSQSPLKTELFVLQPKYVSVPLVGLELINSGTISHSRINVSYELRRYIKI